MSLLAWFRGLFGKLTKKRQRVDNKHIYATYLQNPTAKLYVNGAKLEITTPKPGPLTEADARFVMKRSATSTSKQVARKLNKLGYLTPRGKKWSYDTVNYWRQTEQQLQITRERCREYDKNRRKRRQPQTMIFRSADLRQTQRRAN